MNEAKIHEEGTGPPDAEAAAELLEQEAAAADPEPDPPLYAVRTKGLTVHAETLALEPPKSRYDIAGIWFMSAVGSQTACKGVAANLLKSNPEPAIIAPNAALVALGQREYHTAGRAVQATEKWSYKVAKLPRSGAWHLLIYNLAQLYDNGTIPFILLERTPDDPADAARLHHLYLSRRLPIPLHREWAGWLWERAKKKGEIKQLSGAGRKAWLCRPDEESIARELRTRLKGKKLYVPELR